MEKQSKWIICSGGALGDWALPFIREADVRIGADRGALFLVEHGFDPDVALGDFDSVDEAELASIQAASRQLIPCDPVWKDLTDTELALVHAIEQGAEELVLCGVLGTRLDHSLANVQLLRQALESGIRCRIVDEHNELQLIAGGMTLTIERGPYTHVSLLPLTPEAIGITLSGFLYPLHDATLMLGQSLGISNVLISARGTIALRAGLLLVVRCSDQPVYWGAD